MNKFRLWKALVVLKIKSKLVYRASSLLDVVGRFLQFWFRVMIWVALLGSGARFGTTLPEMITYMVITSIALALGSSTAGREIVDKIRDGSIASDFTKPVNLKPLLFFNDLGNNIFNTLALVIPVGIIVVAFGFTPPVSAVHFWAFLVSLLLGTALQFYYNYILGLFSFWLLSNPFLKWHFKNVANLLSGQILPIWLYPVWLANLTVFLPFRYFVYEPVALYLGKTSPSELPRIIIIMTVWLLVLYGIERFLWYFAKRKLIIQGG